MHWNVSYYVLGLTLSFSMCLLKVGYSALPKLWYFFFVSFSLFFLSHLNLTLARKTTIEGEVRWERTKKMKGVERIFLSQALSSRDTSTPMCHKDMKFFLHLPPYVSSSQSSFLLFPYIIRKRLRILFIDITYTYDTHTSHFSI